MTKSTFISVAHEGGTSGSPALHYQVYEARNSGPPRHTIVLSHALGCDRSMWNGLIDRLTEDCRIIAYDHRGHGQSEFVPTPITIADLADDAARVIEDAGIEPVVWLGISLGGMVGQELALRHPRLISALIIADSTSRYPDEAQIAWQQRIVTLEQQGIPGVVDATLQRFFTPAFHQHDPATVNAFRRRLLSTDLQAYLACCHAVRAIDTTDRLEQIAVPVQIIVGDKDQGTPVAMAQIMADKIPYSRLAVIPDAAHLSVIEQPNAFFMIVSAFLREL